MCATEQKHKAVLAVIADGRTVTQVPRDWGVSRQTCLPGWREMKLDELRSTYNTF